MASKAEGPPFRFPFTLHNLPGSILISLGVTLASLFLYLLTFVGERPTRLFTFVHRLELALLDLRFQFRGAARPDPRILIVDIDQRSQEQLGRWPFARSHFATLLDVLREEGARVVAFDITFSQPDDSARIVEELRRKLEQRAGPGLRADPRLASALSELEKDLDYDRRFAESVERLGTLVLGNFFLYTEADLRGLDDTTLDRNAQLVAYHSFSQVRPATSAEPSRGFENLVQLFADRELVPRGATANTSLLTDALRGDQSGAGFFNIYLDEDGVVRRAMLALPYGRSADVADWDFYPSLDVEAVRVFLGLRRDQVALNFGAAGLESLEFADRLLIRPDDLGRVMINYRGPVRTYPYISIADVVTKNFVPGTLRDKLVLVGASATGIGDLRVTPYATLDFPGVEVHANVIDNLLNNNFLERGVAQVAADLAAIILFGLALGLWLERTPSSRMALALVLLLPFAVWAQFAFQRGWWLNLTVPVFFTLIPNTGLVALYRVLVEEREKRRVRRAFQQYVSPEVVRRLLANPSLLEPHKTEITVMFSDIRGFAGISEQLDAQELARLLNEYLTTMTRVVFRHQGTLDKYIGDAVMAFWGAPFEDPAHARRCCLAALEMLDELDALQQRWTAEGRPVLQIGIGINTGVASVGNMGSELRYGYTAMGDSVNLASRLEALNRLYGTRILITDVTAAAAGPDQFLFREIDWVRVLGTSRPVPIYELLGPHSEQMSGEYEEKLAAFAHGLSLYRNRKWSEGRRMFEELLARWPDEGPAQLFLTRCEDFVTNPPPPDWDGVFSPVEK